MTKRFDIFLSHNSKDKPAVRALAEALRDRGLKVWLDEWELIPGRPWQEALEEVIETTSSSAVLVGKDGLGPWQDAEMRGCLSEFAARNLPVIPVLLPEAATEPKLPFFLMRFTWVDLRSGLTEEGLDRLQWGATGKRPDNSKLPSNPAAARETIVAAAESQTASAEVRPALPKIRAAVAKEQPDQKAWTRLGAPAWIGLLMFLGIIVVLLSLYFPKLGALRTQATPAPVPEVTDGNHSGKGPSVLSEHEGNWGKIASLNRNSIVLVKATAKKPDGTVILTMSTGLIVNADGYILTCSHAIPLSNEYATVELAGYVGGRNSPPLPVELVMRNQEKGIALIKLPQNSSRWRSVESSAQGKAGAQIMAMGFSNNERLTVISGTIESLDGKGGRWLANAATSPGMVGSPLFDRTGAVIGILEGRYEGLNGPTSIMPIRFASDLLEAADSPLRASWR